MQHQILSGYLDEIARIRATRAGTGEISYYGALSGALNAAGDRLKPRVFCVPNLRNRGSGFPDMGLFVASRGHVPEDWPEAQSPERGVVEVDDIPADLPVKSGSAQVRRYLDAYGLVLVTNYRDFVLLGRDARGQPERRESFTFDCADAAAFFALARSSRRPPGLAARFAEFLERVLLHQAPLARPEDVAFFLASYARDALARIDEKASLPAFAELRNALQEALGLRFEGPKGEHVFRSSLVQTLFYGLFSAWVEVAREGGANFDWRAAGWSLHVPFVDTLFQRIATPQYLKPLGLEEPLSWAAAALNRVDRDAFFARFDEADAVRYFYEPFLAAFDPALRTQFGVWYTPREIVRYMVERVDQVLRSELGLADGLADPSVWVLDPCCGTGAYLVEVLDRIARTLREKGEDALVAEDLKQAAMTRVTGFEIMPAPYVIAHWQVGHALRAAGAPLRQDQRAAVYLTNALTGWAAPRDGEAAEPAQHGIRFTYPPLADERDEAARVKQARPILVVLGNPPYNAFAGTSPAEESGLVEPYKEGLQRDWGIRKFNLDDLYVRFFRLAERRIAEQTGQGVVCFISNFSYLSDPSYVVMRQRFLSEFDALWLDCLNGDSRETGKLTPDGKPDPSVFSTEYNREGIRVGTTIGLMVRKEKRTKNPIVQFRQFWGVNKRKEVLDSLKRKRFEAQYEKTKPRPNNRYSFRPSDVALHYLDWPRVIDFCAIAPSNGLMEKRGGALMGIDRNDLGKRMSAYFDPNLNWESYKLLGYGLTENQASFDPPSARKKALTTELFEATRIVRYAMRPFETIWCYYTSVSPVWNRSRPPLWAQCWKGNRFLLTRFKAARSPEGSPFYFTHSLCDDHILSPDAVAIPFQLKNGSRLEKKDEATLFDLLGEKIEEDAAAANLAQSARDYLIELKFKDPDKDASTAGLIWVHALAIGYSPAYLTENADGIRQDWPRIPLPASKDLLLASAELGLRVAALLDTETAVAGVTDSRPRPELNVIGSSASANGKPLNRKLGDFDVTAGWGHGGKGGITMPGRGKMIARDYIAAERAAIEQGASELGLTAELALAHLGTQTCDVYLNGNAYWRGVPLKVWEYTIGGYQVMKKWLSYREVELLGRSLTLDEVREVTNMARRIAAILLLEPQLDANYLVAKENCYEWKANV